MREERKQTMSMPSARTAKIFDVHGDEILSFILPDDGVEVEVRAEFVDREYDHGYCRSASTFVTKYGIKLDTALGVDDNGSSLYFRISPKSGFTPEEVEAARGLLNKGEAKLQKLLDYLSKDGKVEE